jgi:hypothetical protein
VREVNRLLDLGAQLDAPADAPSLAPVIAGLPYLELRTGRSIPGSSPPSVVDALAKALVQPGAGDGRKLVEATQPCTPGPAAPGTGLVSRAAGKIAVAERLPNASERDEPRVVLSVPVDSNLSGLLGVDQANQNVALLKKCDDAAVAGYGAAVLRYLREELARLAVAGAWSVRGEAELSLLLVGEQTQGKDLPRGWKPRMLPVVPAALSSLDAQLRRENTGGAAVATAPAQGSQPAEAGPTPPVEWSLEELPRAIEILSRAGLADLDSCSFLLPQFNWNRGDKYLEAPVLLSGSKAALRCQATSTAFEVTVWVADEAARPPVLKDLQAALTTSLGQPAATKGAHGSGFSWRSRGGRTASAPQKALGDPLLGTVTIPLGSN